MNILLVKPYNLSDHIQPSLGLGYLATALRSDNEIKILDCIKERISIVGLREIVKSFRPQVVGFQCYTFDLKFIKNALTMIKGIDLGITTLVGGPHSSALPAETMYYFGKDLDYAFRGECEKSLKIFIDNLKNGKEISHMEIPGLIWRENDQIRFNDPFFEYNLDNYGMPSWDLIHPETYPESQHGAFYKKFPIAPIILTRGCPYQCTFCAGKTVSGSNIRKRSVNAVINEIKILHYDYGIREFHIVDDNFSFDKIYAKSFFTELIKLKLDISLAAPNGIRMETLDDEMLSLMKKSGMYLISLGIESGSDRVLKVMKKNLNVEKTRKIVHFIREHGFEIAGFFIMGFPKETKEDILSTIRLSLDLDLVRANFFTYLPFPGTESFRELTQNGSLEAVDWDNFYFMNAAYTPDGISRKQLKNLQRLAFLRFYLRPKILWSNFKEIQSPRHLRFLLKRFTRWIVMG